MFFRGERRTVENQVTLVFWSIHDIDVICMIWDIHVFACNLMFDLLYAI